MPIGTLLVRSCRRSTGDQLNSSRSPAGRHRRRWSIRPWASCSRPPALAASAARPTRPGAGVVAVRHESIAGPGEGATVCGSAARAGRAAENCGSHPPSSGDGGRFIRMLSFFSNLLCFAGYQPHYALALRKAGYVGLLSGIIRWGRRAFYEEASRSEQ